MPLVDTVKEYLSTWGLRVLEFQHPTPTVETAAAAVGCSAAEIAKSILVMIGGRPVMVVTCGDMKISSSKLKKSTGLTGKVAFPGPDEVIRHTGYAPGGVSPFLLPKDLPVLLDSSMRRFPLVYPAGGNDCSSVGVPFQLLAEVTCGIEVDVCNPTL